MSRHLHALHSCLKWIGLGATILVGFAWAWSYVDTSIHDLGSVPGSDLVRAVQLCAGECCFTYCFYPAGSMTILKDLVEWPWLQVDEYGISMTIVLWKPFLMLCVLTIPMWFINRKRFPVGCCEHCGYNLTGNTRGVCPECGRKTQ